MEARSQKLRGRNATGGAHALRVEYERNIYMCVYIITSVRAYTTRSIRMYAYGIRKIIILLVILFCILYIHCMHKCLTWSSEAHDVLPRHVKQIPLPLLSRAPSVSPVRTLFALKHSWPSVAWPSQRYVVAIRLELSFRVTRFWNSAIGVFLFCRYCCLGKAE